ncbi:hypothetical protein I4U23_030254 [Adineta vaga]|nr:hypothetical protein I4U23_030254 [Adineta vaga]
MQTKFDWEPNADGIDDKAKSKVYPSEEKKEPYTITIKDNVQYGIVNGWLKYN